MENMGRQLPGSVLLHTEIIHNYVYTCMIHSICPVETLESPQKVLLGEILPNISI